MVKTGGIADPPRVRGELERGENEKRAEKDRWKK